MKPNQIICGDNIDVVKSWPANCIDSIVTDPPYGLGFMGKDWDTFKQENVNKPKTIKLTYKTDYIDGVPVRRKNPEIVTRDSGARRAGSYDLSRNPEFQQWFTVWAKAMLRIIKPGGFLLCFGGTRTYHRLACAIEDAGWEIRDCMMWLYGSGFPKSHNISKAIDKAKGAERKVVGKKDYTCPKADNTIGERSYGISGGRLLDGREAGQRIAQEITTPATNLAQLWDGYGTALKPAWEPILVCMKPLDGTFAHNAETHGVAGLNIDGGRIGTEKIKLNIGGCSGSERYNYNSGKKTSWEGKSRMSQGRWPANLILDEETGAMLDEQSGNLGKSSGGNIGVKGNKVYGQYGESKKGNPGFGDSGGASRFFYCAKTSRKERNMGMEDSSGKKVNDGRQTPIDNPYQRGETIRKNTHPTVKPLALMKYLCTLLKMPSAEQIILDPFMGSGTTGMACKELGINFIGIEKEREYCEISVKRIATIEGIHPFVLHTDNLSAEVPKPNPPNDEHRQRIIDAASAALRKKTL